jgi:hypothetical protein
MGRLLVATVVVLAVCCSPAQAATTVAKVGDLKLRAREKGGRLCITLFRNARNHQGMACGRVPRSPHRPLVIFPDAFVDHYVAAVAPSVRTAETEDRKGRRARHRTFPGRGFGVRFVLIPAPPSPVFVRFYGIDGALLGMDAGMAGYITLEDNETRILGERGVRGVSAHTEPRIAPTPDQPDRIRTIACAADLPPAGGFCFDPDPGTPIDGPFYRYRGSVIVPCAPRLAFAYGRMPDDRRAPEVLLAGGRSVRARRIEFPGDDGWVAFLPDTGVRGLKGGRSRVPLRLPAASEQCGYSLFRAF